MRPNPSIDFLRPETSYCGEFVVEFSRIMFKYLTIIEKCGIFLVQKIYLIFLYDGGEKMRQHEQVKEFAVEDIIQLVRKTDLSDLNTFLVLNGGTGVGKTTAIMNSVLTELDTKFGHLQSMLVVESRSITVEQLRHKYGEADVCQRLGFANMIKKGKVDYDWVVIDECHGLFSEASFAEDTVIIGDWIKNRRTKQHIIFITANDEYFEELSKQFFSDDSSFIYLFPDFTKYVSNTYVKEIQFVKTKNTNATLDYFLAQQEDKKGIIFLKSASKVKDWYFKLLDQKKNVAMLVSRANQTALSLDITQAKIAAKDLLIELSDGQSGLTLADLQDMADKQRIADGKESLFTALREEHLPEDINILIVTDTLQEGMSLTFPKIDYMIIDGYGEVEIRQKVGRFRGNLDQLFIIFNPNNARRDFQIQSDLFAHFRKLQAEGDQVELAKQFGLMKGAQFKIKYLIERAREDGTKSYEVNEQAYLHLLKDHKDYLHLMGNTEEAVQEMYSYLGATPSIIDPALIKFSNQRELVMEIAERWRGIPLKGPAQEALLEDFKAMGITDKSRHQITSLRGCTTIFNEAGVRIAEKQATTKDIEQWPQYLTKVREKFRVIV